VIYIRSTTIHDIPLLRQESERSAYEAGRFEIISGVVLCLSVPVSQVILLVLNKCSSITTSSFYINHIHSKFNSFLALVVEIYHSYF
jgi:hypothetical protein